MTLPTTHLRWLVLLAVLFTVLNCCKPLHIDDTAYHYYADQIAHHPLDPYGLTVYWWDQPEPANEVLAPALLPYWWSLAIRLFGESPFLWKLWLFPFALLFVGSLYALLHRFARGLELPLTWLTVLSPTFLPGFNLMLDVPALALSLAAVAVFCRAADRDSPALAALAGLLAGLSMQTKYTGLLAPVILFLYALLFRKLRLWLVAVMLAVQVFVSWEFLLAVLYGRSHFLFHARGGGSGDTLWEKVKWKARLLPPLIGVMGSIGLPGLLLALTALRVRRGLVLLAGVGVLLIYVLVACVGGEWDLDLPFLAPFHTGPANVSFEGIIFGVVGLCLAGVTGVIGWRLAGRRRSAETFLLLWLGLELVGYFFLTPFTAVRRLLGLTVAGTLLCGRLASLTCRSLERKRLIQGIAVASAVLGLGFFGVDWLEANAQKELAEGAAREVRRRSEEGTIWYVGHWGFQYYAERAGMRPVAPSSRLHRGDWLVFPDERLTKQCVVIDRACVEPMIVLEAPPDSVPLHTVVCYYAGRSALEHRRQPTRLSLTIYRITADVEATARQGPDQPCGVQ